METEQSLASRVGGILRILLGIIIVVLFALLLIRIITVRQHAKQAGTPTETTAKTDDTDSATRESTDRDADTSVSTENKNSSSESTQDQLTDIPRGIDESTSSTSPDLPEAGIGKEVLFATICLSATVFLWCKYRQSSNMLSRLG